MIDLENRDPLSPMLTKKELSQISVFDIHTSYAKNITSERRLKMVKESNRLKAYYKSIRS